MIRILYANVFVFTLSLGLAANAFAQLVVTTTVGSKATFEVESKVFNPHLKQCSIAVTQPNGTTEVVVLTAPSFKATLSYSPTAAGTAVISWQGQSSIDGKVENIVVGGVKQLFNNIGEVLTIQKLSQVVVGCPGSGTIAVVANPVPQPVAVPVPMPASSPSNVATPRQTQNRLRSTAAIPTVMNPPIEISDFKAKYSSDPTYREMVDDFNINRSKQSLTALRLYSELGDANAQFMYGLAHLEDWTGLYDPKRACYWIRESAVKGLSQARLALANKAVYDKQCFDAPPTLDEAKIWAQLAAMSIDRAVKENAEKLLQEIVRFQITNQRQAN